MELSTIKTLLIQKDHVKLIDKIKGTRDTSDESSKQYQPENHKVIDPAFRKKREITVDSGEKDSEGNLKVDNEGNPLTRTIHEEVARITTAAQKQIVDWAVQIAAGVPVEAYAKPEGADQETMYAMVKKTLKANKIEFLDQEILRLRAIYKICAEIWYEEDAAKGYWGKLGNGKKKMSLMIMSEESGDLLYPIRNNVGKMIALGRGYILKDDEDKDVNMFDIYFADYVLTYAETGGWKLDKSFKIPYGKANFIVHEQARTEWEDVQGKIERLETLDSNQADQNDATGSPIIVASKLLGLSKRGETGKIFETDEGGDIKILEAAGAPEAMRMERENLVKGIFDETNTPQISFSEAQGFGANVPGITIKLLFLPATLKALGKQSGGWGMSVQRRFNFLMAAMAYINPAVKSAVEMDISPKFSIYMPENITEKYDNIVKLVAAGLVSKVTAIKMLGLVDDAEAEWTAIQAEAKLLADAAPKALVA